MKPPPFEYRSAASIEEAAAMLSAADGTAKLLAGGQSLVPMMNFRLLGVEALIDINKIPGLAFIEPDGESGVESEGGGLRIGALTRHHAVETSSLVRERFPVLGAAMDHVAHLAIRNRGTFAGSLSHADPAAEMPAMSLLLDARIKTASPGGGRTIDAGEFFTGALTTALEQDEIVTEIEFPALPPNTGWGFEEMARRSGDFAIAGAAAAITLENGAVADARIALMGVDDTPMRARDAEALLKGKTVDPDLISAAAESARDGVTPNTDLHGSADYRRHLVGVLTRRVLEAANRRAMGEKP